MCQRRSHSILDAKWDTKQQDAINHSSIHSSWTQHIQAEKIKTNDQRKTKLTNRKALFTADAPHSDITLETDNVGEWRSLALFFSSKMNGRCVIVSRYWIQWNKHVETCALNACWFRKDARMPGVPKLIKICVFCRLFCNEYWLSNVAKFYRTLIKREVD